MRPMCTKCKCEFRLAEPGVTVIELAGVPPRPYKAWSGDLYRCPGCRNDIVTNYGNNPIATKEDQDRLLTVIEDAEAAGSIYYCYETPVAEGVAFLDYEWKYLGDGLYIAYDGYHIVLRTYDGRPVYIEPQVFFALRDYAKRTWNLEPEKGVE